MFDTRTWQQLSAIRTSAHFWSAVVSNDDSLLYALAHDQHGMLVVDIATMRETRTIRVEGTPALALVASGYD